MFRFRVRTLLFCVTVSAICLAIVVAMWKEGRRHEQLRNVLTQQQALVGMSYTQTEVIHPRPTQQSDFVDRHIELVSTLPWLLEVTGMSRLFRRIDTITLHTVNMETDEIERLLSDTRSVGSFNHLLIAPGDITNEQVADLVSDLPINCLTLHAEVLRASKGRWRDKQELKQVNICGITFDKDALEMLPTSIEKLQLHCRSDDSVTAANLERFPSLQEVHFMAHPQPKLAEVLASQSSRTYEVFYQMNRL